MVTLILGADLPAPPAWERWILEQPIPAAVALTAVGVVLFFILGQRGQVRQGVMAAVGGVVLGLGVLAIGMFVTTTREHLRAQTEEWLTHVFAADAENAAPTLSEQLTAASAGRILEGFNKPMMVSIISGFDGFRVKEWDKKFRGAVIDGDGIGRTQVTLRVVGGFTNSGMMPSTWEFTWRRSGDGTWHITRLECLSLWGQTPPSNWHEQARRFTRQRGSSGGGLKSDKY